MLTLTRLSRLDSSMTIRSFFQSYACGGHYEGWDDGALTQGGTAVVYR